ncbi:MAG: GyrI-like domain-containing protein [Polyangiales bacterium]
MPRYHIAETLPISLPAEEVHAKLSDFRDWPSWSPWTYMEKAVRLEYTEDAGVAGHGYSWEGDVTGSGSMTLKSTTSSELVMDLDFVKPFKSHAKIRFDVVAKGDATDVTWHMDGSMPFFLFWMIPTMKAMLGSDFARGLKLFKEHAEEDVVRSRTEVVGVVDVDTKSFVAVRDTVAVADLGPSMRKTLPQAFEAASSRGFTPAGPPMSVIHNFDMKAQRCEYSAAIPVSGEGSVNAPAEKGRIRGCRALKVVHTGAYEHLSNAWATAKAHQRHLKLKDSKVQGPFEVYMNDPSDTAAEALLTEIYLPIR